MKTNRTTYLARSAQLVAGVEKHLTGVSTLPVAGSNTTPADLVKLVQSGIDAAVGVTAAHANWIASTRTEAALNAKVTQAARALRQYVINAFGATSPVLADFGFAPPKQTTRTPEQRAAMAVKARATRAARHTMGRVQKKSVKGNVTGVIITPVRTAPTQPTSGPSAAPSPTTPPSAPPVTPAGSPSAAPSAAPAAALPSRQ